jgi:DNA polymerase elongation subunit (family B)
LIRHPKLIAKDTARFGPYYNPKYQEDELFGTFYNPNYEPPNQFDSMEFITSDMIKQVQIMSKFVEQSGTLTSLLTVSAVCDMEPKNVMNRGQSFRVLSLFYRDLYNNQLYFDDFNVKRPTVLLPIKREDSSFPDPPWLTNPDIHELMDDIAKKKTKNIYPTRENKRLKIQEEEIEKPTVVAQDSYSGGLVLIPVPGFWKIPIWTLDWASMYPNIIISFNICTMTLIRDSKWLQDPDVTLQYIPRTKTHCDVRVIAYKGKPVRTFLPGIVARFLELREEQRTLKKNAKTKEEELARAMAELAMKTSANACYGFFGAKRSPMCSFAIASAVTQIGQHMQKTVRHRILSHRNPDLYNEREPHRTGGAVLYGDTDSCMACFPVSKFITDEAQKIEESKKQAQKITDYCTQYFKGNTIIVESLKNPLWMLPHKKTYVCIENGKEKMKGIGSIKRDKCGIAREVGVTVAHNILYNIFSHTQQHCDWLKTILEKVPFGIPPHFMALEAFILSAQLKDNYRADTALALEVAEKIKIETGNRPCVNDRVSFVLAYVPEEKMHGKKAYPPSMFLKRKLRLDCEYYFEKQIFGCLKQLLSLPIHTALLNQLHVMIRSYVKKWKVYCMMQDSKKQKIM